MLKLADFETCYTSFSGSSVKIKKKENNMKIMAVAVVAVCLVTKVLGQTNTLSMSMPILSVKTQTLRLECPKLVTDPTMDVGISTNLSVRFVKPSPKVSEPKKIDLAPYQVQRPSAWDNLYYAHQQEYRARELEEMDLFGKVFHTGRVTFVFPACWWQNPSVPDRDRVTVGGLVSCSLR